MKRLFLLSCIILTALNSFGQFEINAEIRPRAEVRHGYKLLPPDDTEAAFLVSQRTRLNFIYSQPKFRIGIGIQDVRTWGDESMYSSTGVLGDNASIDLNEGWIEIFAGKYHTIKFGRQYWFYEDERLLSKRNWNQNSVKYDGILYRFEKEPTQFHLGLSLNNNTENTFGNDYHLYKDLFVFDTATQTIITKKVLLESKMKTQNFIYFTQKISNSFNLSMQALATGYQKAGTTSTVYFKGTYGLYLKYKPGSFNLVANAFYQNGKNTIGKTVNAWFLNFRTDFKKGSFRAHAGIDLHSGQNGMKTDSGYIEQDHLFDVFYGARHKYYGSMDCFDNLSKSTQNGGLADLYAGAGYSVAKNTLITLDYHYIRLQN
ncbi:MAG: hypothetical protein FJY07_14580, partial [Bacteroidetes bacterium]|nr:hypothetical protein [Bacteroidota bacterium]